MGSNINIKTREGYTLCDLDDAPVEVVDEIKEMNGCKLSCIVRVQSLGGWNASGNVVMWLNIQHNNDYNQTFEGTDAMEMFLMLPRMWHQDA
jgi:hypothetical protein